MGNFFLPGLVITKSWTRVLLGGMNKNEQIDFLLTNVFSSNLNTMNLKLFYNHCGTYRFEKNLRNILER